MRLLLDTSAYSALRRAHPEVVLRVRSCSELAVSAASLGELLAGFAGGTREAQNRRILDDFLTELSVSILSITRDTAERYATIRSHLLRKGKPVPTNDIWIAACAMEHGLKLLTLDDHFRNVEEVVIDYIPPAPA